MGCEEALEMLDSRPGASENPLGGDEILECYLDPVHRRVVENRQIRQWKQQ
jgi:hypothetical protein